MDWLWIYLMNSSTNYLHQINRVGQQLINFSVYSLSWQILFDKSRKRKVGICSFLLYTDRSMQKSKLYSFNSIETHLTAENNRSNLWDRWHLRASKSQHLKTSECHHEQRLYHCNRCQYLFFNRIHNLNYYIIFDIR